MKQENEESKLESQNYLLFESPQDNDKILDYDEYDDKVHGSERAAGLQDQNAGQN